MWPYELIRVAFGPVEPCTGDSFSDTDDRYPIVNSPGFISIVVPGFARTGLVGARAYELQLDGGWVELPSHQAFQEAA
jgi:hypothetical protein